MVSGVPVPVVIEARSGWPFQVYVWGLITAGGV
jgi:hypothetical protein